MHASGTNMGQLQQLSNPKMTMQQLCDPKMHQLCDPKMNTVVVLLYCYNFFRNKVVLNEQLDIL